LDTYAIPIPNKKMAGSVQIGHPNAKSSKALNVKTFLGLKTKSSIEISNPVYSQGGGLDTYAF
jgi:hypothetical protein